MKERLDKVLTERDPSLSREKAKRLIMAGVVFVDGQREDKPGTQVDGGALIEIRGKTNPYVSRGGLKLHKAFEAFDIDVDGKVCLDAGASTGGFTDCMLQHGAKKVFSVDVGYGQLDWKLRNDPRVVCMEKTNVRYLKPETLGEPVGFATADLSFISLTKVLEALVSCLSGDGQLVTLVKPQFEAGREKVGKRGVVRDPAVHVEVIEKIAAFVSEIGLVPAGLTFSPVKGPEGNIEYLMWIKRSGQEDLPDPEVVVYEAFERLQTGDLTQ